MHSNWRGFDNTNQWFKKNLEAYFPIEGATKFYVEEARDLLMTATFDGVNFRSIKLSAEKRISVLKSKLPKLSKSLISLHSDLTVTTKSHQDIDNQFNKEDSKKKRDLVGSIFPQNLCFDGDKDRTARVNDIALNITLTNKELGDKKKRTKTDLSDLPASVVWAGIEPATHGFSVHCSTD